MSDYRRNIKPGQRFEYGIYQFLDHFLGREKVFKMMGKRRKKFYVKLLETLKASGEGKIMPIERRSDITLKEFKEHYMAKNIPVVFSGIAKDWDCVKKWSFEYFKDLHGDDEALMATQENMKNYETCTLREVIENIETGGGKYFRFYPLLDKHPEHFKDVDYKWLLERKNKFSLFDAFQVFIGGKNTISFIHHANPPNLFVQVWGRKDWILYPQYYSMVIDPDPVRNIYRSAPYRKNGKPFDPFNPDYEAPFELYKYIDGFKAELQPGDILWTPPHYWHTVKNISDSIGMGYRWAAPLYALKITPFYMFLDLFAFNPPIWKSYKLLKRDTNLIHLAEAGKLDDYLKEKAEKEKLQKAKPAPTPA
jgi:hypothetical protein